MGEEHNPLRDLHNPILGIGTREEMLDEGFQSSTVGEDNIRICHFGDVLGRGVKAMRVRPFGEQGLNFHEVAPDLTDYIRDNGRGRNDR